MARTDRQYSVSDLCRTMDTLAPENLAQAWDNVGLLAGDPAARVRRAMLCIDLTSDVVEEATREKIDFLLAYHPPIFKPITSLRADSKRTDAAVFQCIRHGVAIYATHTALDAADGGTNDVLASMCGIKKTEPLEYVDQSGERHVKVVVYVPPENMERVAQAIFNAGGGHIGNYSHCSYRSTGEGTFLGGENTNPAIGQPGRLEKVEEVRFETIVPERILPGVVDAMVCAHPYEEPAYDLYNVRPKPARGFGRIGNIPRPLALRTLARKLKRATGAACTQIIGSPERIVGRAVILVGAAGSIPFRIGLQESDVIITGEIRHHDALTINRLGCTAIALNHWTSERPVLTHLAQRIAEHHPGIPVILSQTDREPFQPI